MQGAPLEVGVVVAERYRVSGTLGRGATGTVYAVEHARTGRALAMKVLHAELSAAQDLTRRFEREAQAIARLDHAHVLSAIDFGEAPGVGWYLVTDRVRGAPLAEALAARPEWAPAAFAQLLDVLDHAHEQGILHRDLKPDNVLLADRAGAPHVTVLDFGLAKVLQGEGEVITQQGAVFGTPRYMSPEQAAGEPAGPASDLYAVGVMLFEVFEGRAPFEGGSVAEVLTKHITAALPAFEACPAGLQPVIRRCLDKDPEARFERARELSEAMQVGLRDPGAAPEALAARTVQVPAARGARRPSSMAKWGAAAIAVVGALGLALALTIGGDDRLSVARGHLEAGRLDAASAALDAVLAESPKAAGAHLLRGHVARARAQWGEAARHYQSALELDGGLAEDPQLRQGVQQLLRKRKKRGRALARWIAEHGTSEAAGLLAALAKDAPRGATRRTAFEGLERLGEADRIEAETYLPEQLRRVRKQGCRARRWYVERMLRLDDPEVQAAAKAEIRRKDPLLGLVPQSGCMKGLLKK